MLQKKQVNTVIVLGFSFMIVIEKTIFIDADCPSDKNSVHPLLQFWDSWTSTQWHNSVVGRGHVLALFSVTQVPFD